MNTEDIELALTKVGDQDTIFGHGYTVGYAFAKIQDRQCFTYSLLPSQLPTLRILVGGTDGQMVEGEISKSAAGIEHVSITVTFP